MKNLDLIAARTAQEIIKATQKHKAGDVDNLTTKALGVLQENGVYATMLYLYSRTNATDKPIAKQARQKLVDMLVNLEKELELRLPKQHDDDATTILEFLTDKICDNLDRLLLVKQLWEQTLIYVRYGAKARSAAEDKQP